MFSSKYLDMRHYEVEFYWSYISGAEACTSYSCNGAFLVFSHWDDGVCTNRYTQILSASMHSHDQADCHPPNAHCLNLFISKFSLAGHLVYTGKYLFPGHNNKILSREYLDDIVTKALLLQAFRSLTCSENNTSSKLL